MDNQDFQDFKNKLKSALLGTAFVVFLVIVATLLITAIDLFTLKYRAFKYNQCIKTSLSCKYMKKTGNQLWKEKKYGKERQEKTD